MQASRTRLVFSLLATLSLAIGLGIAGYALTGSLTWGYDVRAI